MEVLGMIDITNCNKIIIDTNEKVEKIIDWCLF